MSTKKKKESWQGHNKKGIRELREALKSAKSADEMLKVFRKIESQLEEKQLCSDCWIMALQYHKEGQHPKVIEFGKRALNNTIHDETSDVLGIKNSSTVIASILDLMGYACFELKRYTESLIYLKWSDRNLSQLLLDNYDIDFVLKTLRNTHITLSRVKRETGRGDEVFVHLKKVLEISEKIWEKGCVELGYANFDVSIAYLETGNCKEALSFGLKALEIYGKHLSDDSGEVTMVRTSLGRIYSELGEFDKAFEQNRLSLSGFRRMGDTFRLLMEEVEGGKMLVELGRYEEAIEVVKAVVSQAETAGYPGVIALASMVMAKALCRMKKFDDASKYMEIAHGFLEKKELAPEAVATAFMEMSKLHEEMKEYEAAISLVQKALDIPEISQDNFAHCSLRLFSLVSLTGTRKKMLSSLEEVLEKLKEKFGSEHCHVGYGYVKMGLVYMELGKPEMAAELLVRAKDIFDVSLGPDHLDSLTASQTLSDAYEGMGSFGLAIANQEKVIEGFKGLGLGGQDSMDKAVQLLNMMNEKSIGEVAESSVYQSKAGEDLSAADSKHGE